jgi:hypothetical protein
MLSVFVRTLTIRVNPFAFHLTRFPIEAQMAVRLQKSRACFASIVVAFTTRSQNSLTWKIIATTMLLLTGTYVLVDKKLAG